MVLEHSPAKPEMDEGEPERSIFGRKRSKGSNVDSELVRKSWGKPSISQDMESLLHKNKNKLKGTEQGSRSSVKM